MRPNFVGLALWFGRGMIPCGLDHYGVDVFQIIILFFLDFEMQFSFYFLTLKFNFNGSRSELLPNTSLFQTSPYLHLHITHDQLLLRHEGFLEIITSYLEQSYKWQRHHTLNQNLKTLGLWVLSLIKVFNWILLIR